MQFSGVLQLWQAYDPSPKLTKREVVDGTQQQQQQQQQQLDLQQHTAALTNGLIGSYFVPVSTSQVAAHPGAEDAVSNRCTLSALKSTSVVINTKF